MRRHPPIPHRQRGSASVETVLVAPLLLLLITAALISVKLMFLNLHNRVESRVLAWNHAVHGQNCQQPARQMSAWSGRFGAASSCISDKLPHLPGHQAMAEVGVVLPASYWVSAAASAKLEVGVLPPLLWRDIHSLDAQPEWWPVQVLPLGHDRYLDTLLNTQVLFVDPPYFPGVGP